MLSISKTFYMESAHTIPGHPKCGNMHGHSYQVDVFLKGTPDQHGMVKDFAIMKAEGDSIFNPFDHHYINDLVWFIPTAELLAEHFLRQLQSFDLRYYKVIVHESRTSFAEIEIP